MNKKLDEYADIPLIAVMEVVGKKVLFYLSLSCDVSSSPGMY
jgi:hypothetical protein